MKSKTNTHLFDPDSQVVTDSHLPTDFQRNTPVLNRSYPNVFLYLIPSSVFPLSSHLKIMSEHTFKFQSSLKLFLGVNYCTTHKRLYPSKWLVTELA